MEDHMLRVLLTALSIVCVCSLGLAAADEPAKQPPPQPTTDNYKLGPDSLERHEGVPKGRVEKFAWTSNLFPRTERDCWVYIPAQYDGKTPACVMVFQDGGGYVSEKGSWRAPVVFDNLIHKKQMPVTVGIFINPGTFPPAEPKGKARSNRSFEYDTLSDQYAKF